MNKKENKNVKTDSTCFALNQCVWKKNIFVILVLLLPIANFFVFWLYPNIDGILLGFKNMEAGQEYWTLSNFKDSFNEIFRLSGINNIGLALKNTLIFFAFSVITFPLGLFWGYVFYKKIRGYNFFRLMFFVPSIVSAVILANLFKYMIDPDGPISLLYMKLYNVDSAPMFLLDKRYAFKMVIIYHYWAGMAGSLLLLGGAFAKIPEEIIESARIDGVTWWTEMWKICIPLIWPTLSTLIIVTMTTIFFDGSPVLLITGGGGESTTVNYWMYAQIKITGNYYMPSAFGLILTFATLIIVMPTRKLVNSFFNEVEM